MGALWRGAMPLRRAFWEYAVFYGLVTSALATGAALAAVIVDLPGIVAAAFHLLPVPYYLVAMVGVWRSADAYAGPPVWAQSARIAVVPWTCFMVIL